MLIMPMVLARRMRANNAITTAKTAYNCFILPPAELEEMSSITADRILPADYYSTV